ncbi:MAG: YidB family protein [Ignavibacteria bacterium]|nr:YidB family protein [Ignavibacteria bacterium]
MDVLNTVKSAVGGVAGKEIMPIIIKLISEQSGGLSGLIQKFTSNGLGDVVNSWVGTGEKLPISADQISKVLGPDIIKNIAEKTGLDTNAVTGQLTTLLPQAINKLTPDGKIPEGDILKKGMDMLGGLKGGKF